MRPIGYDHFGHAQSFDGGCRPCACTAAKRGFFCKGHLVNDFLNGIHVLFLVRNLFLISVIIKKIPCCGQEILQLFSEFLNSHPCCDFADI